MRPDPRRDRGFALLLVLWSLVLLTLITTRLVAAGRDEARLAANLRAAAQAESLADAAVHQAAFRLLALQPASGRMALPGGIAEIGIEDEAGRVNPNQAGDALLQALLALCGADRGSARNAAAAIMDWRSAGTAARQYGAKLPEYRAAGRPYAPPNAPFRSLDEVGLVLGVTPPLLACLTPLMTLSHDGDADPDVAGPVVLAALRQAAGQADIGGSEGRTANRTVRITAFATGRLGGRFGRQAVLQLAPDGQGRPYRLLDWRRVDG